MVKKHMIAASLGALALVMMTAGASAWITSEKLNNKPVVEKVVSHQTITRENRNNVTIAKPVAAQQQQQPACDDGNIAGTVLGGAAGGIVGSQIGNGNGQTAATIGGVVGGAILGREYIPTQNVTCR